MSNLALGLIETIGLTAAFEAADAAVKSANVRLIGYELTKGDGMVTVKIEGDVGSVKAGVDSAVAAASRIGKVYSFSVIARPANGLEKIVLTADTVGKDNSETSKADGEASEESAKTAVLAQAQPEPAEVAPKVQDRQESPEPEGNETEAPKEAAADSREAVENEVFSVTSGTGSTAEPEASADITDESKPEDDDEAKPVRRKRKSK